MAARPTVLLDPHFRRVAEIFSPADLRRVHQMVVDDLDAFIQGLPPQRLQIAQSELIDRYASGKIP